MTTREITQTVTAHRQREGAGGVVRWPFPSAAADRVDPCARVTAIAGEALGVRAEGSAAPQAFRDHQSGKMGEFTRTARIDAPGA